MAFDENGAGVSAERDRRGVVLRAAGDDVFGLANVGDDGLEREADASGHAGQAERRAHDLEESAAGDGVEPFGGAFGEFAVQGGFEFFGAGEFFEAAPVFGAGFFGGVVGRGLVDAFADGGQVQFFVARADVFALLDLDQAAVVFLVVDFIPFRPSRFCCQLAGANASVLLSPTSDARLQSPGTSG